MATTEHDVGLREVLLEEPIRAAVAAATAKPAASLGDVLEAVAARGLDSRAVLSHLVGGLAHPLRTPILRHLQDVEAAGPKDLALVLNEPLGVTSYHVRKLECAGLIVLAAQKARRGTIAHFYALTPLGEALLRWPGHELAPELARALRHPFRPAILRAIAMSDGGRSTPKDLADQLGASIGVVSHHIRALTRAGLIVLVGVEQRRGALAHYYSLTDEGKRVQSLLGTGDNQQT